jgi:hypothetical protein
VHSRPDTLESSAIEEYKNAFEIHLASSLKLNFAKLRTLTSFLYVVDRNIDTSWYVGCTNDPKIRAVSITVLSRCHKIRQHLVCMEIHFCLFSYTFVFSDPVSPRALLPASFPCSHSLSSNKKVCRVLRAGDEILAVYGTDKGEVNDVLGAIKTFGEGDLVLVFKFFKRELCKDA